MKIKTVSWLGFLLLACLSLAGAAEPAKLKIVLVGDSTVNDQGGWGYGFKQYLQPTAECINTAMNGRSTKSFIQEGRWTNALALHGDYYFIQFGHNNQPGHPGRETDMPTYIHDLERYVDDVLAQGAKPVLVTPLSRRQWDEAHPGHIQSTLEPYAAQVLKIAAAKHVPVIDLHARSLAYYEQVGRPATEKFSPVKVVNGTNVIDTTHLAGVGRVLMAQLVVAEVRQQVPALQPYLRSEPDASQVKGSESAAAKAATTLEH